jgi:heptosyltransferase-1
VNPAERSSVSSPRVLIVRLGALGDIVHALPLASALRERWPDATIDWLVERRHRALVDLMPVVSHAVPFDSRALGGREGWLGARRRLRAARYDVALDAQGLVKSALVARLSGARRVVGFAREHLREGAASVFYSEVVHPPHGAHVVRKNLELLRATGLEPNVPLRFPLAAPAPRDEVTQAIAAGRFVLLNPGGGWPNKRWPAERFGRLAHSLRDRLGLPSLVLWGPGDEALAETVVSSADGAAVRAPRTDLGDLLALCRAAAVLVSGDTGPLHLAAAVGTRVVGIYGPTDPARNGPWDPRDVCVSRREACECYHRRRCRAARWCLDDVGVEEVAGAVYRRVERG